MSLSSTELILNPDGSVYHLHLRPEQIATTIITVGDPERVSAVSQHFDEIEHQVANREFITHTGRIGKKPISVISTGIGTDNIDIVMNELDALVNIDLETRTPKQLQQPIDFIRIGTSGALQRGIPMDSFLVSSHGLGMDGLGLFYDAPHIRHQSLKDSIEESVDFPLPVYLGEGSYDLAKVLCKNFERGITVTCSGFYAPQGRELRLKTKIPKLLSQLARFNENGRRITNFEMETAGIYFLSNLLGHRAISCNAIIANRKKGTFSQHPKKTIQKLILTILERWADA